MKKFVFVWFLGLLSSHVLAMPGTTTGGYVACLKKEWLDDMISFAAAKDMGSFRAYIDSKKCIPVKKGLKVTITEPPGMFGGTAGFLFNGIKFWTVREGLEYNK